MRYTTAVGQAIEVSGGPFKAYMYCHGCQHGTRLPAKTANSTANKHAATCRRVPSSPSHYNRGSNGRR